jgi:tripartite-type tricarboxylate transporter receptor subunit TctC
MHFSRRETLKFIASAAAFSTTPSILRAQSYPIRLVRIVVPFPAGPGIDAIARIIANRLSEVWNMQVIVENRAGAGGNIGSEAVARSEPDGYTMLFHGPGLAVSHHLYERLQYSVKDLAPVVLTTMLPNVMVVPNSSEAKSLREFLALARSRKSMTFGSPGTGTTQHLSGELLKQMAKLEFTHVPYRGSPQAMTDVIAGRVDSVFANSGAAVEAIRAGQVRGLAVTSAKRFSPLAELPSIGEAVPGYDVSTWFALFAPAKTPPAVIKKINADTMKVLGENAVKQRLEQLGAVVSPSTSDELASLLATELDKWEKVIKEANIKPE